MNTSVNTFVLKERQWALNPFRCFVHDTPLASILAHLGVHGIEARSLSLTPPSSPFHKARLTQYSLAEVCLQSLSLCIA